MKLRAFAFHKFKFPDERLALSLVTSISSRSVLVTFFHTTLAITERADL